MKWWSDQVRLFHRDQAAKKRSRQLFERAGTEVVTMKPAPPTTTTSNSAIDDWRSEGIMKYPQSE
jgi:hypothetical protein